MTWTLLLSDIVDNFSYFQEIGPLPVLTPLELSLRLCKSSYISCLTYRVILRFSTFHLIYCPLARGQFRQSPNKCICNRRSNFAKCVHDRSVFFAKIMNRQFLSRKNTKISPAVFRGCSSDFARSHPRKFSINWRLVWAERASWAERNILRDALSLERTEFVQQLHLLSVHQLLQLPEDLESDRLLLLLFETWPKFSQASPISKRKSIFQV